MRIFKNKDVNKWANDIGLTDESLLSAAHEIVAGNYEASLGKKVFKKLIAIGNKGKSGSGRTIVAFKQGNNVFFMFGFAKGKKSNISPKETKAFQLLAKLYLAYSDDQLNIAVREKKLFEVKVEVNGNG